MEIQRCNDLGKDSFRRRNNRNKIIHNCVEIPRRSKPCFVLSCSRVASTEGKLSSSKSDLQGLLPESVSQPSKLPSSLSEDDEHDSDSEVTGTVPRRWIALILIAGVEHKRLD